MGREHEHGVESTAALNGHPLHPAVIPFPIAFLIGVLVTDIVYMITENGFWAEASFWLIIAGLLTAAAAAVLGLIEFTTIRQARNRTGWTHMLLNVTAVVIALVNLGVRLGDREENILPLGLLLSALVAAILTISGWLGGELSYKYRIGVKDPARDEAAEAETRRAYGD